MESYLAIRNNNASKNINVYINPDQTIREYMLVDFLVYNKCIKINLPDTEILVAIYAIANSFVIIINNNISSIFMMYYFILYTYNK